MRCENDLICWLLCCSPSSPPALCKYVASIKIGDRSVFDLTNGIPGMPRTHFEMYAGVGSFSFSPIKGSGREGGGGDGEAAVGFNSSVGSSSTPIRPVREELLVEERKEPAVKPEDQEPVVKQEPGVKKEEEEKAD